MAELEVMRRDHLARWYCGCRKGLGIEAVAGGGLWVQHGENHEARRFFTELEILADRPKADRLLRDGLFEWLEQIHQYEA